MYRIHRKGQMQDTVATAMGIRLQRIRVLEGNRIVVACRNIDSLYQLPVIGTLPFVFGFILTKGHFRQGGLECRA